VVVDHTLVLADDVDEVGHTLVVEVVDDELEQKVDRIHLK
jgi:hypothetical protein